MDAVTHRLYYLFYEHALPSVDCKCIDFAYYLLWAPSTCHVTWLLYWSKEPDLFLIICVNTVKHFLIKLASIE